MVIEKQVLYSYFFILFLPFFAINNVRSFFTSEYYNIKMFLYFPLFQNDVRIFWGFSYLHFFINFLVSVIFYLKKKFRK